MNQPARTRLVPPFVLSLVMLASLYIFAYYPLTYLFHLERGGTLQALPMVSCILLGVILAAVVLGGGAAALGFLAWKMFKVPLPEEPEEEAPLPEEAEEENTPLLEEAEEDEEN